MEISHAFFAEAVQITGDGRMNILGADLHVLNVQGEPPWTLSMLFFVMSIQLDREDCGRLYHVTADLITPSGEPLEPHMEGTFIAPVPENPELIASMRLVLQLTGSPLPALGAYHMQMRVEDRERGISQERRVRLRVAEAVPRNQPA